MPDWYLSVTNWTWVAHGETLSALQHWKQELRSLLDSLITGLHWNNYQYILYYQYLFALWTWGFVLKGNEAFWSAMDLRHASNIIEFRPWDPWSTPWLRLPAGSSWTSLWSWTSWRAWWWRRRRAASSKRASAPRCSRRPSCRTQSPARTAQPCWTPRPQTFAAGRACQMWNFGIRIFV